MALSQVPTTAEVKSRANPLKPEQVNPRYGITASVPLPTPEQAEAAYEADIAQRIVEQAIIAEHTLLAHFTSDEMAAFEDEQNDAVEIAIKLLTVGDLYDSAGQLNERYQAESERMMKRGYALLDALVKRQGVTDSELASALVTPRTHGGTFDVFLA